MAVEQGDGLPPEAQERFAAWEERYVVSAGPKGWTQDAAIEVALFGHVHADVVGDQIWVWDLPGEQARVVAERADALGVSPDRWVSLSGVARLSAELGGLVRGVIYPPPRRDERIEFSELAVAGSTGERSIRDRCHELALKPPVGVWESAGMTVCSWEG